MITEAVILAGGLGTRLRSAVPDLPKCMAPVAGRPFVSFLIDYYSKQGIKRFIFSLGYKHEVIEDFLRQSYPDLDYVSSIEDEPLGTGGGILKAIRETKEKDILILNGDTFFEIDVNELSKFHEYHSADCSLTLKPMQQSDRYGVVEIDKESRITSFKEKNYYENSLINGGVYVINKKSFLNEHLPVKFSFEKEYLEALYQQRKIFGCTQDKYFIDIGIPEDYNKADNDFKNVRPN